jgi:hypothetical protein
MNQIKRIISIMLCVVFILAMFTSCVESKITIPDPNFEAEVRKIINKPTGEITKKDVAEITYLNISGKSIESLSGIEHFTSLTDLNCYRNQLTELDLSKNTALNSLICFGNKLTQLDLSQNTALTNLQCQENQLIWIDAGMNDALNWIECKRNPFLERIYLSDSASFNMCDYDATATIYMVDEEGIPTMLWTELGYTSAEESKQTPKQAPTETKTENNNSDTKCASCDNTKSNNSKYCLEHKCFEPNCSEPKTKNSNYCSSHTCMESGCYNKRKGFTYCSEHECAKDNCSSGKASGSNYCSGQHKCMEGGCKNPRHSVNNGGGGGYCVEHECAKDRCTTKKAYGSNYCNNHK